MSEKKICSKFDDRLVILKVYSAGSSSKHTVLTHTKVIPPKEAAHVQVEATKNVVYHCKLNILGFLLCWSEETRHVKMSL